eukprot:Skav221029  [mRNA]  locus=scaffold576:168998:170244:- [translate_table: standard]
MLSLSISCSRYVTVHVEEKEDRPERVEDDGTGGEWEQSTGLSKQAQKRKEKQEQIKKEQAGPLRDEFVEPVMCPVTCEAASKEEIAAFMAKVAEKGAAAKAALEAEQASRKQCLKSREEQPPHLKHQGAGEQAHDSVLR